MHVQKDRRQNLSARFLKRDRQQLVKPRGGERTHGHAVRAHRAVVLVDLVQQSHGFFAQVQRSGVAGRRRALRQANRAEDAQEGGESQPHVGSEAMRVFKKKIFFVLISEFRGFQTGAKGDRSQF